MLSTSIYTPIKPTYLYIKQHSITGLKYFGKTTKKDPHKYLGSGGYWTKHIKKYGKEFVQTIWISDLYYDTYITEVALHFSIENDIVESNDWANLILENGLDGGTGMKSKTHTKNTKNKMSLSAKTVWQNESHKLLQSKNSINLWKDELHRNKIEKSYIVIAPTGERLQIKGLSKFCNDHNLNCGHMSSIANGYKISYKGWKCELML